MTDNRDTACSVVIADLVAVLNDHGLLSDDAVQDLAERVNLSANTAAERGHAGVAELLRRDAQFLSATLIAKAKRRAIAARSSERRHRRAQ